ncbi:MAG: hypothetical protein AAGD25_23580 [Cyanobacteria bacterium P01_F01_bin.150]
MQSSMTISQPWRPLLKVLRCSLGKSLAGLALATSIVGYGLSGTPLLDGSTSAIASTQSLQMQVQPMPQLPHAVAYPHEAMFPLTAELEALTAQSSDIQASLPFLDDGTYLYGEVTEPEQVGVTYMVFDVSGHTIMGAFYMPSSSFDCFQGAIQSRELSLTIHDSYSQETFPYEIALVPDGEAIAFDGQFTAPALSIDGFHPIAFFSDNDQRILATCRADLL